MTENLRQFLTPRYWPTWVAVGTMYVMAQLPARVQVWIGTVIGLLFYYFARSRRRITETNIRLCFPELDARAGQQLVKDSFISNGIGFVEICTSWWLDAQKRRDRLTVIGLEHLQQALKEGHGALLIGAHFSTLDLTGALLTQIIDFDITYRENKNKLFDAITLRGRERIFGRVIHRRDIRGMMRSLKDNHALWYAPDQDYGAKYSVFVPFFGVNAATVTGTTRLAKFNNSSVHTISHFRNEDKITYTIIISEPIQNFPSGDETADAARINQLIETEIRKDPAQYLWMHRRFKTRPPGEAKIY